MKPSQTDLDKELAKLSVLLRNTALGARTFEDALSLARLYGRLHWQNISGFFADAEFEELLFDRWKDQITGPSSPTPTAQDAWCHVASKLYPHGGHSKLFRALYDELAARGTGQSLILTRKLAKNGEQVIAGITDSTQILKGSLDQRCRDLFRHAVSNNTVVLHIHPDDIAAALVARALREAGVTVLYVNHADHVFSFGTSTADCVLEICATGWRASKERRGAPPHAFMGIPMLTSQTGRPPVALHSQTGPVLSVGIQQKYSPTEELNFARFLEDLMARIPNDVLLIGPKASDPMWQNLRAKYMDRLKIPGPQPHNVVQKEIEAACCYVDSFPLDGGTVFSQALLSGTPSFGLNRQASPGVSPIDLLRCSSEMELAESIVQCVSGNVDLPAQNRAADDVADLLSRQNVVDRVLDAAKGTHADLPDSLRQAGNRSIDYNADRWRADGRIVLPSDIWRQVSMSSRLSLWRDARRLDLSAQTRRTLTKKLLVG